MPLICARDQCRSPAVLWHDGQISRLFFEWPVQPLLQKYFGFPFTQITSLSLAVLSFREGRWPSSRTLGSDAVDAAALLTNSAKADGEVVWS